MPRLDDIARRAARKQTGPELPTWWPLAAGALGVVLAVAVLYRLGSDSSTDKSQAISAQTSLYAPLNSTTPPSGPQTSPLSSLAPSTSQSTDTTTPSTSSSIPSGTDALIEIDTLSGATALISRVLVEQVSAKALSDTLAVQASVSRVLLRSDDVTGYYLDVTVDLDGTLGNSEVTTYYSAAGSDQEGWRITRVR